LRPTREIIRVVRKNNRQKCTGSLKIQIPNKQFPQLLFLSIPHKQFQWEGFGLPYKGSAILITRETRKPISHQVAVVPVEYLAFPKQKAKPTSNNPAIIRNIQLIKRYGW
jgi:hypothetical protein